MLLLRLERAVILVDQFFQLIDRNNDGVVGDLREACGISGGLISVSFANCRSMPSN